MKRTPEQAAADDALAAAIRGCAAAYGEATDSEFVGAYLAVVHWLDLEDDGSSRYTLLHANGHQPGHVALGLVHVAADILCTPDDDE